MKSRGHSIIVENLVFRPPNSGSKGILKDISFTVDSGEFITFIGRNGHGKTSIFKAISGELKHSSGTIRVGASIINGPIQKVLPDVSIVHQYVQDDLIPEISIKRNIQIRQLLCNNSHIRKKTKLREWAQNINTNLANYLDFTDFTPTTETLVSELSGGQRQLLNILIALIFEHSEKNPCKLLLLDEHLTSLDVIVQKRVMDLITKIVRQMPFKPTILMITHDFEYAIKYSDRIFVVDNGSIGNIVNVKNNKKISRNDLVKILPQ